jgi:hypothetical protein
MKYNSTAEHINRAPIVKMADRWMVTPPTWNAGPVTTSIWGKGIRDFASGRSNGLKLVNGTGCSSGGQPPEER